MARPARTSAILSFALGLALAGCSGGGDGHATLPPTPAGVGAAAGPGYVTPARWDYHPAAPRSISARMRLPDGGCVLAAEGGQRWLVPAAARSDSASGCGGRATAASGLLPEEATDIVRHGQSSWLFVGRTGRIYVSNEPLGPVVRILSPPTPLSRVAGAGARLLGVTSGGKLLRWDGDASWQPLSDVPAGNARVHDLALASDGRALALAFPESLFASSDGGKSWQAVNAPKVGAQRVGTADDGSLAVEGLLESLVWTPGAAGAPALGRSTVRVRGVLAEPELDAGRGASASAVASGLASIDGERVTELVPPEEEGEPWALGRGRLDGRLDVRVLPGSTRCVRAKMAARGRQVVVACLPEAVSNGAFAVELLHSSDGGESWRNGSRRHMETRTPDAVGLAVAPDGRVLVTGLCDARPDSECAPAKPVLAHVDGNAPSGPVRAPELDQTVSAPAFSGDGRAAYVLARTRGGALSLFVSHDGGETFAARPLDPPGTVRDEDSQEGDDDAAGGGFDVHDRTMITSGEDGTLGMLLARPTGEVWVTASDDGRQLEVAYAENEGAALAGFGKRVVAVGRVARDEESVALRESFDGGKTWLAAAHPRALVDALADGSPSVACGGGGCLVGDNLARVGWGGAVPVEPVMASAAPRAMAAPRAGAAIGCEPSGPWVRLGSVDPENTGPSGAPRLDALARGAWLWAFVSTDRRAAQVTISGARSSDARVVTRSLFGRGGAKRYALEVSLQMEGFAAARVPVSEGEEPLVGAPMRDIELAWENLIEGSMGRARVADAGTFEGGDVRRDKAGDTWEPALVSVSPRGIYLRPHHEGARASHAFFADTSGRVETLSYPSWPDEGLAGPLSVRSDAAHVGTAHLAVGMVQQTGGEVPSTFLLGHFDGKGWQLGATALAPPAESSSFLRRELDWSYQGSTLGVTTLARDPLAGRAWAAFHPFRGDGSFAPPVPLATDLDLADRPRACEATDRAQSARLVTPLLAGEDALGLPVIRHRVRVGDERAATRVAKPAPAARTAEAAEAAGADTPAELMTGGAVIHGAPGAACLAAWELTDDGGRVGGVVSGNLERGWLFRRAESGRPAGKPTLRAPAASGPATIEYRPVSCRWDTSSTPAAAGAPSSER